VFWEAFAKAIQNPPVKNKGIKVLIVGTLALNRRGWLQFLKSLISGSTSNSGIKSRSATDTHCYGRRSLDSWFQEFIHAGGQMPPK